MNQEVAGDPERRRGLRPMRMVAILAAVIAAVGGLALNPLPAHADHSGIVTAPYGGGFAALHNYSDGSEYVRVCDTRSDSRRVWATFYFPGSTEQPLWAPSYGCAVRMPGIPEGAYVYVNVCESNLSTDGACTGRRYLGRA